MLNEEQKSLLSAQQLQSKAGSCYVTLDEAHCCERDQTSLYYNTIREIVHGGYWNVSRGAVGWFLGDLPYGKNHL